MNQNLGQRLKLKHSVTIRRLSSEKNMPVHIPGVLWYQGEANTINAYAYKEMLLTLIKSWRDKWG
jgi:hypothetical protein